MIVTPCRGVCKIDNETALCRGCGRTLEEISNWQGMTQQQRQNIMNVLEARHGPHTRNKRRIP